MTACPARLVALAFSITSIALIGCSSADEQPLGIDGWAPMGARTVGSYDYEIIPEPNAFHGVCNAL